MIGVRQHITNLEEEGRRAGRGGGCRHIRGRAKRDGEGRGGERKKERERGGGVSLALRKLK